MYKINDILDKVVLGDALTVLKKIPSKIIDMVMTSPPYWACRDYGVDGQIGRETDFRDYVNKIVEVCDEIQRVLKDEGTFWLNLGDSPSKGASFNHNGRKKEIRGTKAIKSDLPAKCLCAIPERIIIKLIDNGWILREKIVWYKPNAFSFNRTKDNFHSAWEYVFLLVKQQKYYFEQPMMPTVDGLGTKVMKNVWIINTKPGKKGGHIAPFPVDLVETPIKAGCPVGGIVLDPFFGSGTVGRVSSRLDRHFIGIDIKKEYVKDAAKNLPNRLINIPPIKEDEIK